jgi:hypothetical protein
VREVVTKLILQGVDPLFLQNYFSTVIARATSTILLVRWFLPEYERGHDDHGERIGWT